MFYQKVKRLIGVALIITIPLIQPVRAERDTRYNTIEWNDLLTQDDLQALMEPDDFSDIVDGSEQDTLTSTLRNTADNLSDSAYQRALTSTVVRDEHDKKKVRIAGFVVPIDVDSNQSITTFFLVPYYGACVHMPPPPPNQIIYSTTDHAFKVDDIYAPYWIEGTMATTLTENNMATSAYSMVVDSIKLYE